MTSKKLETLSSFLAGTNPYGIAFESITTGRKVVVDIPIDHNGNAAEVEGVVTQNIWCGSPNSFYSQILITQQNTRNEEITLTGLCAIYPERVKRIF